MDWEEPTALFRKPALVVLGPDASEIIEALTQRAELSAVQVMEPDSTPADPGPFLKYRQMGNWRQGPGSDPWEIWQSSGLILVGYLVS